MPRRAGRESRGRLRDLREVRLEKGRGRNAVIYDIETGADVTQYFRGFYYRR